jgi:hypothetical protein
MVFYSLLIAKQIFIEFVVGFLIFRHTHKDIGAHFNYFSKLLKMKNTYILANLIKAFMNT